MTQQSLIEFRRRLGPRVWWYSLAVSALGLVFVALCIELSIGFLIDRAEHQTNASVKRARLHAITEELTPLHGLSEDIGATRISISRFYSERVPASYSQIVSSLGDIGIRSGVSLSHVSYVQGTPGSDLSEVSMEVSVAGDYSQLIHFVNGIERDR